MRYLNHLSKGIGKTTAWRFRRLLSSVLLGVFLLGFAPSPVQADSVPVDLVLGGAGATPWVLASIKPGSSGVETVELRNAGSKDGFVTIWISDIVSSEGINPESETGDTAEPGELDNSILLDITAEDLDLVTNIDLPAKLGDFPQSYNSGNSIEVIPIKSGDTVSIYWRWELPSGIGNDAQGDIVYFTINYLLRECKVTDVSGVTTETGTFTEEVVVESDTAKGTVMINKGVVGQTRQGQPLSWIWLIDVDKQPQVEPQDETIVSLWEIGPDGATFDQSIRLTLGYKDPEDIPQDVQEKDLTIALWDGDAGKWVKLDGAIVDTVNNTISAQINHFSRYAITGHITPPPSPPPAPGPGGGGIVPPPEPEPSPPPVEEVPTASLNVNMLGQERTVEIGIDGTLFEPLTLGATDGKFVIELDNGSQIITSSAIPPERLELMIEEESFIALTGTALPDNMVLLSPIYRLTGYIDGSQVSPIYFRPSATLSITYDKTSLPENILTPFIAYLVREKGLTPIGSPSGSLVEVGKAQAEIYHASLFVVAAELVPPPLPLPAEFALSNLTISPQRSYPTEPVTISVNIANNGETKGTYELYLQIDGIVKNIEKLTLDPGSSKEVTFRVSDLAGGIHEVKIGDLTGRFEIITKVTVPAKPTINWPLLDLGIGVVIFISLVGLYLFRKRARTSESKSP